MGTKGEAGAFDAYERAKAGEPVFTLLGRDPTSGILIRLWARLREEAGDDPAQIEEALFCAAQMDEYARSIGRARGLDAAVERLQRMAMGS